jgi:hypothetical protein
MFGNFVITLMVMVFNATFKNISVIQWQSDSFIGGGNQRKTKLAQVTDKLLSDNVVSSTPRTDCIQS